LLKCTNCLYDFIKDSCYALEDFIFSRQSEQRFLIPFLSSSRNVLLCVSYSRITRRSCFLRFGIEDFGDRYRRFAGTLYLHLQSPLPHEDKSRKTCRNVCNHIGNLHGITINDIRGRTIKFANSPPCACRCSTGKKRKYGLMTLSYQRFTALLLLIYGSLFLSGIY